MQTEPRRVLENSVPKWHNWNLQVFLYREYVKHALWLPCYILSCLRSVKLRGQEHSSPRCLPAPCLSIAKSLTGLYSTRNWATKELRPSKWPGLSVNATWGGGWFCYRWNFLTEPRLTSFIAPVFCGRRFKYRCNKLLHLGHVSTAGICDKHLWRVDTCHVVGTVHLYKYWSLVRFPRTVCKCDTNQSNYQYRWNTAVAFSRLV